MGDFPSTALKQNDPAWPLVKLALSGQRHPDPEVRVAAERLLSWWWSGAAERLDRVVGIAPAPGQRSAQTQAEIAQRDELVRKLAADYFPDLRSHPAAVALHRQWARYASSSWPRERMLDDVPPHRVGKPEGTFWQIMRLQDRVLSERSIRKILAAS